MKKTLIIIVILVETVLLILFAFQDQTNEQVEISREEISKVNNKREEKEKYVIIKEKNITEDTELFNISIVYPEIDGLDDFNLLVEKSIENQVNNFKYSFSGYSDMGEQYIDWYLYIDYEIGTINEELASIVFFVSDYTGGIHGSHYSYTINYDLKKKKKMVLKDLFPNDPNYLQTISDFCLRDLKKQIKERSNEEDRGWPEEGAAPKEENFSTFLAKKDSIVFYFSEYEVSAYIDGGFSVEMPRINE